MIHRDSGVPIAHSRPRSGRTATPRRLRVRACLGFLLFAAGSGAHALAQLVPVDPICGPGVITVADAWHKGHDAWNILTNVLASPSPKPDAIATQVLQLQGHLRFLTNRTTRLTPDLRQQLNGICAETLQLLEQLPTDAPGDRPVRLRVIASKLDSIGRLYPGDALIPNSPAALTMSGLPAPTIRIRVLEAPRAVGKPAKVRLRLETQNGKPVGASLLIPHQEHLLHALVLDASFSDYHHEHPTTNGVPGEYEFSFTPRSAEPYRLWVNLISQPMALEEFPWQNLGPTNTTAQIERKPRAEAHDGRSKVTLRWPAGPPRAGRKTVAEFRFTDDDGKPRQDLEMIMGSFGHLVGFNEDFRTPLHVHPDPIPIGFERAREGPVLNFSLVPPKSGFWRIFLQTAHEGRIYTSDFTVEVLPQ